MLQEGREVGAGAEVADMDLFRFGRGIGAAMLVALKMGVSPLVIHGCAQRAGNRAGEFAEKLLEGRDSGGGEIRAGDAYVHVEVGDGAIKGFGVLFDPLG